MARSVANESLGLEPGLGPGLEPGTEPGTEPGMRVETRELCVEGWEADA